MTEPSPAPAAAESFRHMFKRPPPPPVRAAGSTVHARAPARALSLACALLGAAASAGGQGRVVDLDLDPPSGEINRFSVEVAATVDVPIFGSVTARDRQNVDVTGTFQTRLEMVFDPETHEASVTGIEFIREGTRFFLSDTVFVLSVIAISAEAEANGLSGTLDTPDPFGPVEPDGSFPTDVHNVIIDQGQFDVTGVVETSLNLAESPVEATTEATGTLVVAPPVFEGANARYDVTLTLPVTFMQEAAIDPPTTIDVDGILRARGSLTRFLDLTPPAVDHFTATPGEVERGAAATLSWSVANALGVTITPAPGAGAPTGEAEVTPDRRATFIPRGAIWKYLDGGDDPGAGWAAPDFDDAGWPAGAAQLGFGDGDEVTVVSFGGDPAAKPITTYFRTAFEVVGADATGPLQLELLRDDGAAVYLNGTEVHRDNLPAAPAPLTAATPAIEATPDEGVFHTVELPADLLREGRNVVAVEVHQSAPDSSDLSFDLGLSAEAAHKTVSPVPVRSTWAYLSGGEEPAGPFFEAAFDDRAWARGAGSLGYGNGDEATAIPPGGAAGDRPLTAFFRRGFLLTEEDLGALQNPRLLLLADDGALVYLNGQEVLRQNLPAGAVTSATPATDTVGGADESNYTTAPLPPGVLVAGLNQLAVEVHQASAASSDLTFDLGLVGEVPTSQTTYHLSASGEGGTADAALTVRLRADPGADDDGDSLPDTWERLHFGDTISVSAGDDPDFDGRSNREEFVAGTDPNDATSAFTAAASSGSPGGAGEPQVVIHWTGVPGITYRVEFRQGLLGGAWQPAGGTFSGEGGLSWTDDGSQTGSPISEAKARFYRIVVVE